jgi:hypothetical protein
MNIFKRIFALLFGKEEQIASTPPQNTILVPPPAATLPPVQTTPPPEAPPVVPSPLAPTPITPVVPPVVQWDTAAHGGNTKEQWDAWQASRAQSQKVTDELGVIGKGVPIMDKATQDRILATFDSDIAARGEEVAWFNMGGRQDTRNEELLALVNRGTYGDYSGVMHNFNKWNQQGTPSELLPPGFRNPKRDKKKT